MIQQDEVLTDSAWRRMKPLGMTVELISRESLEGDENEEVTLSLSHPGAGKYTKICFVIPKFNGNVIQWRNSKKALFFVADCLIDSEFEIAMDLRDESERMDFHFKCPSQVAIECLSDAIARALRNWFYDVDEDYDPNAIQISIDRWFANGEEWRVLKYSAIAQEDQHNGVIIKNLGTDISHSDRMMARVFNKKLWNILDLNSTSFGDKANESFRFVQDASVEDGKIIAATNNVIFCSILRKHAIGLGMNPKRVYLIRNSFEQTIDLVSPEEPWVTPYEPGETNMLHGKNLLTGIMHVEHYTHEDSIVVSQSAANKMTASRTITQLIESDMPIRVKCAVGDPVGPDSVVALDGDREVLANKLYVSSIVQEIKISKGKRFGVETNRMWIRYSSYYPLSTGDKISNRHGGKGVVYVIPDQDMPYDVLRGQHCDICIGPESIINRRSMSALWEMMLARKALLLSKQNKEPVKPIKVKLFEETETGFKWPDDELHNFKDLASKYGDSYKLVYKGNILPETTFVAPMFWMRHDKIAREIVSCVGRRRKKNSFGAVIDSAKSSGQRCNPAKLLALSGRGFESMAADIVDNNASGQKFFQALISAARNNKHIAN